MTAGRSVNSLSQSWCTPHKYVDAIRNFWHGKIALDPCSNIDSIVNAATEFMLPETDGLKEEWNYPTIYVNPPYGADRLRGTSIKTWLMKCLEAHTLFGSEIIALVPVATNTSHWKTTVFGKADAICFLYDTRLKFLVNGLPSQKGAPMACCLIYWGERVSEFTNSFSRFGAVVDIRNLKQIKIGQEALYNNLLFNNS